MSDETPKDETEEVEGHGSRMGANDEATDEGDDDEVEAHGSRLDGPRLDGPRLDGPLES